jgi:tetratricopeptide (TPR) repeat protein
MRRWLAALYLDMKAPNSAIGELQKIAELDPADGRPHRLIGFVLRDYRQYEPAIAAYKESLRRHLEPHVVAEVVGEMAEILTDTGHPADTLEALKLCPEPFQNQPRLQAIRAQCLWDLGKTEEAAALAESVMRADSTNLPVLRLRASIFLAQEQPEAALPLLLRYVRIDPINNQARKLLAQTYRQLGATARADEQTKIRDRLFNFNQQLIELMTQLLLKPQDDELRASIGELWLGIGQPLEARHWFRSALEVNPANAKAKRSLDRLEGPSTN